MTTPSTSAPSGPRARDILSYALLRIESALTIALSILLAFFLPKPFPWWQWWYWIVLGAMFEVLIVVTSISDERTHRKVAASLLRERYDPRDIRTRRYREKVEEALTYREQIDQVVASTPPGALRDHLYAGMSGIADWMGHIFTVAQRLDAFERDQLIQRDLQEVPKTLNQLRRELANERDPQVKTQLEATIDTRQNQMRNLQALRTNMEKAELKLDETIGSLGTVYSQFQRVRAEKMSRNRAQQLSGEIDSQVQRLEDILDSMQQMRGA